MGASETHRLSVGGHEWRYQLGGDGARVLVLLTGGFGEGVSLERARRFLPDSQRLISPTYPPVDRIGQLLEGIVAILDQEAIEQAYFLGPSLGGGIAQCLVRRHPSRVAGLIL
ncbi:MAG: alpha/beta hydrolase, partial [Xanthomonadales bacterium]|nr:alpha/beta hydrolase [Xanthomonadales bacterium]